MRTYYAILDSEGLPYKIFLTHNLAKRYLDKIQSSFAIKRYKGCPNCRKENESLGHMGCEYPE